MYKYRIREDNLIHYLELPWRIFRCVAYLPAKIVRIKMTREYDYEDKCYDSIGSVEEYTD